MNSFDGVAVQVMNLLTAASLKSAAILLAAWAATIIAHRASGALRHLIWTLAIVGILAAPTLEVTLPAWRVAVLPVQKPNEVPASIQETHRPIDSRTNAPDVQRFAGNLNPEQQPPSSLYIEPHPNIAASSVTVTPAPITYVQPPPPAVRNHPAATWFLLVWAVGAIGIGCFGAVGAWFVFRAGRTGSELRDGAAWEMLQDLRQRLNISRPVRLIVSARAMMPMTWGIFRPRLLLPVESAKWDHDRLHAVLLHELAHICRWDCATQLLALGGCAIYWFNPLAWLASRQMRIERERACDDVVLTRGSSATQYAEHLLDLAREFNPRPMSNLTAVTMARRSGLAGRISAILSPNRDRRDVNRRMRLILTIILLAVIGPLSALHLMKRAGASGAAYAAQPATRPATMPSDDAQLPHLPERFSSKRVALRVLTPAGKPMPIDSIQAIYVWIPQGKWMDGPTPEILSRFADNWVFVDKQMLALAQPGQRMDLLFTSGGSPLQVSAKYPPSSPKKITFDALYDINDIGVDTSAGPSAAPNEVAGQVVDPGGKPLAGAVASFSAYAASIYPAVTTGSDGIFRFSPFNSQGYVMFDVEKPGYAKRLLVNVPVGRGFLVHMGNTSRVKGQLTGSDGLPAADAKIDFVTSKASGNPMMSDTISDLTISSQSDAEGRFDLPIEPGDYEMRVSAKNGFGRYEHVEVASGQTVEKTVKLDPGAELKIVAVDTLTGKPAAGVQCYIEQRTFAMIAPLQGSERVTDANGEAKWDNLMPGPVEVEMQSDVYAQWWTDEMKRDNFGRYIDALRIELKPGIPPVTVHVEPGVHVTGTVLSPDGKPVSRAEVNIAGLSTGDSRYAKRTDDKGNFSLNFPVLSVNFGDGVKEPKYAIVASDPKQRWANTAGDWFTPTVGKSFSLTLKLTQGARLRARVVARDGTPIAHVMVRARANDDLDTFYYDPTSLSDNRGRFELGPMRPGHYAVRFAGNFQDMWRLSTLEKFSIDVAEGAKLEVGDVIYDGSTPSNLPQDVQQFAKLPPVPETDDSTWRQVKPAMNASAPPSSPSAVAKSAAQARQAGAPAVEDEIVGDPAAPGELSGKVVDDAGKPLSGVSIRVWTYMPDRGYRTDSEGRFSLKKLAGNRDVEIRFSKDGYCPRYVPQQPTGLSNVVVVMNSKTWFEGRVTTPDGNPASGVTIRADQGPKQADGVMITNVWTEAKTDPNGNYKMYVQPDAYDLQVRAPGIGSARTGKLAIADGEAKHQDISLMTGITFRAHVVDSATGKPVDGVRLWSEQYSGVEGRSDPAGNLIVEFMEPGKFNFEVDAKGYARWWSDQCASEWNRKATIDRAGKWQRNFDNLDFEMLPAMPEVTITVEQEVKIHGKVIDPDGKPVTGATVAPALTGTGNSLTGDTRFSVTTKAGGVFDMILPASGDHDYNLEAHDGKYGKWRKWANGVLPPFRTKPGDELKDVTLTLSRPVVVRGKVVDADGNPIPGREVRAAAGDLLENRYYDPTTRTGKDGTFELKFVRPGKQLIQVAPFWLSPSEAPGGSSKTVTLTEGQTLDDVNLTSTPNDKDH
jgi:beta-lactamase regulating signal transducer with metallopeptidase domain/protocatechuate 3,4-dioxygenase beta subunit/5-hydroxyisourate hydrolase-like protein (transthyretin family)